MVKCKAMNNKKPKYEYDYRYPTNWQQISRQILATYKTCSLCHKNPSKELHHMFYRKRRGTGDLLLADGKVGINWVPLCQPCHKKAHVIKGKNGTKKITYVLYKDPKTKELDSSRNCNTSAFVKRLQVSFKILYGDRT